MDFTNEDRDKLTKTCVLVEEMHTHLFSSVGIDVRLRAVEQTANRAQGAVRLFIGIVVFVGLTGMVAFFRGLFNR